MNRAMREASSSRTVTDTDSYAFSFINQSRQREDDRGTGSNMCKDLRKVRFSLGQYEFHPDADSKECAEMESLSRERIGYFHRWVDDVDNSKDIPYVKTMALVEDVVDGAVHMVEYCNMTFISDNP